MNIESKIFSLRAVTIPMILVIIAFCIKVSVLFYNSFVIDHKALKITASIILSIPVGLTLLTVTVNKDLINNKNLPISEIYFACSIITMLFIFGVFQSERLSADLFQKIFLSIFLAFVEYTYSNIFVSKYNQQTHIDNKSEELTILHKEHQSTKNAIDSLTIEKNNLSIDNKKLTETNESLSKYKAALYCVKCSKQFDTVSRFRNHTHIQNDKT